MSHENKRTIEFYEKHAEDFQARGLQEKDREAKKNYHEWFDKVFSDIPKDAEIFEIGSGAGVDAEYLNSLGYQVQVSDVADSFVKILSEKNLSPVKFDIIDDEFDHSYDVILASAVLVHLTKSEVEDAIKKVYDSLNPGGLFIFTVRTSEVEEWKVSDSKPGLDRYFSYWDPEDILKVADDAGFEEVTSELHEGIRANWLRAVVKKGNE